MPILSWLFPTEEDRLRKARSLMAKGRFEDARRGLVHCTTPEAETLYDECSAVLDKEDAASLKKQARAAGFRGWRVEVSMKDPRGKAQLEALIAKELAGAGVDLGVPDVDQAAVKAALARAERKARNKGVVGAGSVNLVPIVEGARAGR